MVAIESRVIDENGNAAEPVQVNKRFESRDAAARYLNAVILKHRPLSGSHGGTWWIRDAGILVRFTLIEFEVEHIGTY